MKKWLGIDLFANPEALFLLLLIPLYLFWYIRFYQKQRLVIRLSYDPLSLEKRKYNLSLLRLLPRLLQLGAIALMIIAVARPQSADEVINEKVEGIDIMLLLDISGSMESDDYPPSRLEVAKSNAVRFIKGRKQDRIGLVLFAAEALSYSPLTLDHSYLSRQVRQVSFGMISPQGTAIGEALAAGINRMEYSENGSKVMILLTDGANNAGQLSPISAAKLANERGIRTYAIGMGRRSTVTKAADNNLPLPDLDEKTLRKIAQITGGNFYRASDPTRLQQIFTEISQLETRKIQNISYRHVQDRYPIFVKMAIIILGISFLLMLTFIYNPLEQ
ncbi:MAG: VWA domain-containing protein [Bacteroidia bacterium]|nr:VWA domain-containing protein [Bacteroidia bacterium]